MTPFNTKKKQSIKVICIKLINNPIYTSLKTNEKFHPFIVSDEQINAYTINMVSRRNLGLWILIDIQHADAPTI
jgi:hypothetical protein